MNPLLGLSLGVSLAFALPEKAEQEQTHLKTLAKAFVEHLSKGEFAKATKNYDTAMEKALPADKLEETWKSLIAQVGAFKRQTGLRTEHAAKYEIVFVTCEFEKASLDARVVFNSDKQITGLFFSESKKAEKYQVPDYVKQSSFKENEVTIGSGEWQLPGTLTLPLGQGAFPAVVLVHGSGPQDRDETIGPNRPFRDLAWGLASQGIAVLRYEKRTKQHAAKCAETVDRLTIKEEVIDDALAAVALLRKNDRVDAKRIFVLGHSLGAMCAPRIAALDARIHGIILLAGNTRALEDLMIEQLDYVFSLDKSHPEEKKKEIEKDQGASNRSQTTEDFGRSTEVKLVFNS
jgi:dienelactone hydrolase